MTQSQQKDASMVKSPPLISINPATGETIKKYTAFSQTKVEEKLNGSQKIWEDWRLQSLSKRTDLLDNLTKKLLEKKEELSEIITQEMGKPLNQSVNEIEKCILLCRYYKEYGEYFLTPRSESLHYKKSYVSYEPLGGVFGIMPWNFPFWQVFRYAIPALTAGNSVFLKHSENVTACALAIEEVFLESSWPAGIFTTLLLKREQAESVIAHPFIRMLSFTGGTKTGRHLAMLCGKHLKKSSMELGGSDPYVVLEDANIEKAAKSIIESRFNNSGQSCIAAKRVIVEKPVHKELLSSLVNQMQLKTIYQPLYNPDVGPLAKKELVDQLVQIRDHDLKEGAQILFEKKPRVDDAQKGFYFPITVMSHCTSYMRCNREEVFGPLLPIFQVEDEEEAIRLANDTYFGLGGAIFTENLSRGENLAKNHIRAGTCFVNGVVKSNPSLPFGGTGESGYGRELSVEGLREFTNIKTLVVCD